jgi:transposase InsO family protein
MYIPRLGKFENNVERWRAQAKWYNFDTVARTRLEWMIFYHTMGEKNAKATALYFGISRNCFHKWLKKFNPLDVLSLESSSRCPHTLRTWEVTPKEEKQVIAIREKHLCWGKKKLKIVYFKEYKEKISTWKIERVIRKHHLYPDPIEHKKRVVKHKSQRKRVRIHTIDTTKYEPGKLWHVDSIEVNWYDQKRYIITALEDKTKLAYARVYPTHAASYAADFLKRLVYLSDGDISVVHSDNGSEFAGKFSKAASDLSLFQVYSRVRTPNDNPSLERFNRTLQEEWLNMSEIGLDDIDEGNRDLTNWLVEYNFERPHAALDYQTPIEYAHTKYFQVSPMYPAYTVD